MNTFVVERMMQGKRGVLMTLREENSLQSETDSFFADVMQSHPEEATLLALKLEKMARHNGFQDQFFKMGEGSRMDNVCALSEGKLRLYCLRYGNILLIMGGGGVKTTRTYEDDASLHSKVKTLQKMSKALDRMIRDGEVKLMEYGMSFDGPPVVEL
jgi:hypothetical protein